jgi:hypothetical protein
VEIVWIDGQAITKQYYLALSADEPQTIYD